jgi:hypothetical protein
VAEHNPFETLQQMAMGACLPRCLHVVTELGVADTLPQEPRSVAEIAKSVGASSDALHRVLRLLAANGVFKLDGDRLSHTPASQLLRADHPQSMRSLVLMFGLPINWSPFLNLRHSVETGQSAAKLTLPGGYWKYFEREPAAAGIFNAAMAAKARGQVAAVVAAYDFSAFKMIGDIGGGRGHLLSAVLAASPAARGVLFDLPHVTSDAAVSATDRWSIQPGDFFKDPLPVCDLYLLMEVIHDWGNDEAVAILRAVRRSAPPSATLLVLESIVPEHAGPDLSKTLDIVMLALLGGKQRNLAEYRELLRESQFSLEREIPTRAGISILEARPA